MMHQIEPLTQDLAERKLAAAMSYYAWREGSHQPITFLQAARMRDLIGCGWAEALPPGEQHCNVTVELRRLLDGGGRYYLAPDGTVRVGYTLASSKMLATSKRVRP